MLWLLLFSYFYNLPVMSYSIKGDNELRIYDFLGIYFLYQYVNHYKAVSIEISKIIFLRRFQYFLVYCSVAIIITLATAILKNRLINFVQSFLYLYHMWVFFLGAVFFYSYLKSSNQYYKVLKFIMILVIVEGVIIILQNLGLIPFLWSDAYRLSYHGFLSGTLGPNKIVIGMTMLISTIFLIGINNEKRIKKNKILLYAAISVAILSILLSGSRTTYVGLILFLLYFSLTKPGQFSIFLIFGGFLFGILLLSSSGILGRISDVFHDRVTYAIEGPEDVEYYANDKDVYDELSAGRVQLHWKYVDYLLSHPWVIPFGRGFINRMGVGNSAHNMYLSLISEVGVFGLMLFIRWLLSYMVIMKRKMPGLQLALNGLIISMMVTLYFGEHLYVYRPLFAILGYFMMICVMLTVPLKNRN